MKARKRGEALLVSTSLYLKKDYDLLVKAVGNLPARRTVTHSEDQTYSVRKTRASTKESKTKILNKSDHFNISMVIQISTCSR